MGSAVIEMDVSVLGDPSRPVTISKHDVAAAGTEGFQEEFTTFVKQVTGKPVLGVGRFTSPDAMVSQIRAECWT